MKRRVSIVLVAVLALSIAGVYFWAAQRPAGAPLVQRGRASVVRGDLEAQVDAIGRIRALREVRLSLPAGGLVAEVLVNEGDLVKAGQPLLRLDPSEARMRLEEARLNLRVAQAQLAKADAGATAEEVETAQAQVQRARIALAVAQAAYDEIAGQPGAATSNEAVRLEGARADLLAAEAALRDLVEGPTPEERELLESQVELAELRLRAAEQALAATTLTAPFDGLIVRREITAGERVAPNQPVLTLADPETIRAVAEVDEIDVAHVAVGQPATIRLDALPAEPISGTVEHLAPAALPQRGSTVYEATIRLTTPPPDLRLGMAGTVTIRTIAEQDVLLLPLAAIRRAGRDTYVVRLEGGQEEEVSVTLGPDDGTHVVILNGLQAGDVVLLP